MLIRGKCHCGNISFSLTWDPDPTQIPARACDCTFCQKHGGVWTSNPRGALEVALKDRSRVSRYAFGTETAEFLVCARCGIVGPHRAFSPALGGVVCERCRPAGAARPAAETLALLGALLEGRWSDTRQVLDRVAREASGMTAAFVAWHLDRNLRSMAHVER